MSATLRVSGMRKVFPGSHGHRDVVALDDVSFSIDSGTTLGLVGESGSGKSTAARCVLGLIKTDAGEIELLGRRIDGAKTKQLRTWRRDMQIVFQESFDSLDPRMRVSDAIAEPLLLHTDLRRAALESRVRELLALVDLSGDLYDRYPHQLSGGQQQRVNIARALATHPKFIVLDEPTSSLDVSVRAGILRLLVRLQQQLGLTYLLISHDLPTVRHVCDRVAVIYLGRIVEEGPASRVLRNPAHPYTQYLLGSELSLDPDIKPTVLLGEHAELDQDNPHGCVFAPRCAHQITRCWEHMPPHYTVEERHTAACILHQPDADARASGPAASREDADTVAARPAAHPDDDHAVDRETRAQAGAETDRRQP
jgi:oligopeptide/dipeptide ABC transporter ATP-binding protein